MLNVGSLVNVVDNWIEVDIVINFQINVPDLNGSVFVSYWDV